MTAIIWITSGDNLIVISIFISLMSLGTIPNAKILLSKTVDVTKIDSFLAVSGCFLV